MNKKINNTIDMFNAQEYISDGMLNAQEEITVPKSANIDKYFPQSYSYDRLVYLGMWVIWIHGNNCPARS